MPMLLHLKACLGSLGRARPEVNEEVELHVRAVA
jgi:hypothetical protein